eukprot:TRINITY_DN49773_c0_g1_i1.p1 TRINITY_DN49773_c0_g1~~TRINITY_DN49773_c0_g1_i1.p1  ORF type:complete len:381 (-),score=48.06 TRINITY_DN49773_c0_g1_i1:14-1108(-)
MSSPSNLCTLLLLTMFAGGESIRKQMLLSGSNHSLSGNLRENTSFSQRHPWAAVFLRWPRESPQGFAGAGSVDPFFRPQAAKAEKGTFERLSALLLVASLGAVAAHFLDLGQEYVSISSGSGTGGSETAENASRSLRFHMLFAAAALVGALSQLASVYGVQPPMPMAWLYFGRSMMSFFVAMALGMSTGARSADALPAAMLGAGAWLQLGVGAIAVEPSLHMGLLTSGAVSGVVAHMAVDAHLQSLKLQADEDVVNQRLRLVLDLAHALSFAMFAVWLLNQGWGAHFGHLLLPPVCSLLTNGFLDVLFVLGCGHLLLKRKNERVLDAIFMAASQQPVPRSKLCSCRRAGEPKVSTGYRADAALY